MKKQEINFNIFCRCQSGPKSRLRLNGRRRMLYHWANRNRQIRCCHHRAVKSLDTFVFHRRLMQHAVQAIHCLVFHRDESERHLKYRVWVTALLMRMRMRKVGSIRIWTNHLFTQREHTSSIFNSLDTFHSKSKLHEKFSFQIQSFSRLFTFNFSLLFICFYYSWRWRDHL